MSSLILGIIMPLIGTTLGACGALFMKKEMNQGLQRGLTGFAAGVMVAAAVWSLIIPAIEQAENMGKFAFVPATVGLWAGVMFLLLLDHIVPHLHRNSTQTEGGHRTMSRTLMLVLAVALHNLPEGIAVGAVYAGVMTGETPIAATGAVALSLGIAIQNFPEGAIISMPLRSEGVPRGKAVFYGFLSGVVEPIAAILTVLCAGFIVPMLPYFLGFAAGAMLYVVAEELIPDMSRGEHSHTGVLLFALGFTLMMILDVALG